MVQVSVERAGADLVRLVEQALHGEEVVLTDHDRPVVRLQPIATAVPRRRIGGVPDLVEWMADDFNEALDDFRDYNAGSSTSRMD